MTPNKAPNYLREAEEADRQALRTTDAVSRASWERVADKYRRLAATAANIKEDDDRTVDAASGL